MNIPPNSEMPIPSAFLADDDEKTFQHENHLPSLPVPPLNETLNKYLDSGNQSNKIRCHFRSAGQSSAGIVSKEVGAMQAASPQIWLAACMGCLEVRSSDEGHNYGVGSYREVRVR